MISYPLLGLINNPEDLKKIEINKLQLVIDEIRRLIIETVDKNGGHLASNLGSVDLTVALHYCYNTPKDKLIWDVGHQSYSHKIITGRREVFHTLRTFNGISGFPRISESEYDAVSTGHASTSISTALGFAVARDLKKEDCKVIAVIGDGSLAGGLAFEGLNNLGALGTTMTVVLNDNEMSISKTVGALSNHLACIVGERVSRVSKNSDEVRTISKPAVFETINSIIRRASNLRKRLSIPVNFFEALGIHYIGPIDGHNIKELIEVFTYIKKHLAGPVCVHVLTKKGKGYRYAEKDAARYHGVGKSFRGTDDIRVKGDSPPSYSNVFGEALVEIAETRKDVVAITAAMRDGVGLNSFGSKFPDRFFDVGIAEGHAVTFAAGLARKGLKPVVALYSAFLLRACSQVVYNAALDNCNIVFCIDRTGIVGQDGETHHGAFDLPYLRALPNVTILEPKNGHELRNMLFTAVSEIAGRVFIRYPRGPVPDNILDTPLKKINISVPEVIKKGEKCALLSVGASYETAIGVYERLERLDIYPYFVNVRTVKPLDKGFYRDLFKRFRHIISIEINNPVVGGFTSALMELAVKLNIKPPPQFLPIGIPDAFIPQGSIAELRKELGLDVETIFNKAVRFVKQNNTYPHQIMTLTGKGNPVKR